MLGKSNDTLKAQVLDVLLCLCLYGHDRTGGASKLLTGARPHKSEIPIFQYTYLSYLREVCRLRFRYCIVGNQLLMGLQSDNSENRDILY